MIVGFVGGTGPAGCGLATRLARKGYSAWIGSRTLERAEAARDAVLENAPGADVRGGLNHDVALGSDVVLLTVPPEGHRRTIESLPRLDGQIVVNMTTSIAVENRVPFFRPPPAGSMGEEVAELLPGARVVTAFYEVHVKKLADVDHALEADTVICGDDPDAKREVIRLASAIDGMRGIDGGPLVHSRFVESFVAVLISVNFRYRVSSSYRITGVTDQHLS